MMGRHRDPQPPEDAGQAARWRHLNIVRPHLAKRQAMAVVTDYIGQMLNPAVPPSATFSDLDGWRSAQALGIARGVSAAFEEARAVEGLGRSCLQNGDRDQAVSPCGRPSRFYERLGVPGADRVQQTFKDHGLSGRSEGRVRSRRRAVRRRR